VRQVARNIHLSNVTCPIVSMDNRLCSQQPSKIAAIVIV